MNYLLDTNVISELVAKQPQLSVVDWIDAQDPNSIYLSVVTIGEIQKGIAKLPASARKNDLQAWLTDELLLRFRGHILTIDIEVSLVWGELVGHLAQIGRPLAALDSLIAALALHHRCTLVTRNEDDFKGTGVSVLNPWKESTIS
jgi:toxin FitB